LEYALLAYHRLTITEVDDLLGTFHRSAEEGKVVKRYNGYLDATGKIRIYRTWSVLHFLETDKTEKYLQVSG
jgi:hypothetical protein